jgi:solute carrier family 30 (zinc transporter), member 1
MHNHTRLPPPLDPHGNFGVLAVFIHILGDAVNSECYAFSGRQYSLRLQDVGVIVGALIMWKTHSPARFYADPAVSLAISLIIFASAIPLSECPTGIDRQHFGTCIHME